MSSITPKGEFVLQLHRQGLNPTYEEINKLWAEMQPIQQSKKICDHCHGSGYVMNQPTTKGE